MPTNEAVTLLRYVVDNGSVQAAVAANEKVQRSAQTLAIGANPADAAALNKYASDFAALTAARIAAAEKVAEVEAAATYQQRLQLELSQQLTREQQMQAAFVNRSGGSGGVGSSISRFSRGLFNLPDVQITPGLSTTTVSRLGLVAGGGIEAAGLGIGALAAGAALAAPAVLLLAGAAGKLGEQSAQAAENAKTFAGAITQALEAGTTAQIQALIRQKQAEIEIAETTRNILIAKAKEAQEGLALFLDRSSEDLSNRLDQAANDLGLNGGQVDFNQPPVQSREELNAQAEEQNKNIQQAQIALEAYNAILQRATDGVVTLSAAEQELADVRQQLTDARVAREVQAAQYELEANRLTAEERKKQADQLAEEIPIINAKINSEETSVGAQLKLIAQLNEMNARYDALISVTDSYADRLKRQEEYTQRITDQYDNYLEALDLEAKAREEIAATIARINEIIAERDARLAELSADLSERRAEIEQDASDRIAQIAQDSADRIAKLYRDAGREQFAATASRDALAFYQSRIRQQDALDDQRKADQRAIEQVRKTQEKQLDAAQKGYQKQVDALVKSSNKQIEVQQQGLAQLNVDLQNAMAAQQAIALNGSGGQVTIHTEMWQTLNNVAVTWAFNTVNTLRSIFGIGSASSGGSSFGGGGGGFLPGMTGQANFNRLFDNRLGDYRRAARGY